MTQPQFEVEPAKWCQNIDGHELSIWYQLVEEGAVNHECRVCGKPAEMVRQVFVVEIFDHKDQKNLNPRMKLWKKAAALCEEKNAEAYCSLCSITLGEDLYWST